MPTLTPDNEHPMPRYPKDEEPKELGEAVRVSGETAKLLAGMGMPLDVTTEELAAAQELFAGFPEQQDKVYAQGVAARLAGMLNIYDKQIVNDQIQIRNYITNRLIEISTCGNTKEELRALELLGKISDVGLFTEKQEITITHKTSAELEHAIKEKVKRLIHSNVIDIVPEAETDPELDELAKHINLPPENQEHNTDDEPQDQDP